jgi:hypothetical protein
MVSRKSVLIDPLKHRSIDLTSKTGAQPKAKTATQSPGIQNQCAKGITRVESGKPTVKQSSGPRLMDAFGGQPMTQESDATSRTLQDETNDD